MQKITENVYGVLTRFNFMNQYIIVNGDTISIFDMMIGENDVDNLEKELDKIGKALADVNNMLITHAHPDHIGGLAAFQERSNATTYAHRIEARVIRGETESPLANPAELGWFNRFVRRMSGDGLSSKPARVDVDLGDGDVLDDVLEGLQVVNLAGHSYGQVGYYIPHQKLLIGGDVMMRIAGSLRMPIRAVSPDWDAVKTSIQRVADMDVEILCLGHGKPLFNANPVIQAFANRIAD